MNHDPNIMAILSLLAERWPGTFSIHEARRRPLAIGIRNDLIAALDGVVKEAELKRALACYCANKVYRSRCIAGAVRIGLDGEPAGVVTEHEAAGPAAARAAKIPSQTPPPAPPPTTLSQAPPPAPTSAAPKRISLADLREAARLRKADQSNQGETI